MAPVHQQPSCKRHVICCQGQELEWDHCMFWEDFFHTPLRGRSRDSLIHREIEYGWACMHGFAAGIGCIHRALKVIYHVLERVPIFRTAGVFYHNGWHFRWVWSRQRRLSWCCLFFEIEAKDVLSYKRWVFAASKPKSWEDMVRCCRWDYSSSDMHTCQNMALQYILACTNIL